MMGLETLVALNGTGRTNVRDAEQALRAEKLPVLFTDTYGEPVRVGSLVDLEAPGLAVGPWHGEVVRYNRHTEVLTIHDGDGYRTFDLTKVEVTRYDT